MDDFSHRAQLHIQRILDASGDYRFSPSSSRRTSAGRPTGGAGGGSPSSQSSAVRGRPTDDGNGAPSGAADATQLPYGVAAGYSPEVVNRGEDPYAQVDPYGEKRSPSGEAWNDPQPAGYRSAPAMDEEGGADEDGEPWRRVQDDANPWAREQPQPHDAQDHNNGQYGAPGESSDPAAAVGASSRAAPGGAAGASETNSAPPPQDDIDAQPWRTLYDDGAEAVAQHAPAPCSHAALPADLASLVARVHAFAQAPSDSVMADPDAYLANLDEPVPEDEQPRTAEEAAQLLRNIPARMVQNYDAIAATPDTNANADAAARSAPSADHDDANGANAIASRDVVPAALVAEIASEAEARRAAECEEAAARLEVVCDAWKSRAALEAAQAAADAAAADPLSGQGRRGTAVSGDGSTGAPEGASASSSGVDPAASMDGYRFPASRSIDEGTTPNPAPTKRAPVSFAQLDAQDPLFRLTAHEENRREAVRGAEQAELFDLLDAAENNIKRSYRSMEMNNPAMADAVAARYPPSMSPEAIAVCIAVEKEVIRLRQQVKALEERIDYTKEDNRDLRRSMEITERRSSIAMARSRASSVLNDQESIY